MRKKERRTEFYSMGKTQKNKNNKTKKKKINKCEEELVRIQAF